MARGTAQHLSPVCAYVAERTGTSLSVQQVARLQELLAPRLGAMSQEEYVARLKTDAGAAELAELMSAISVHKTDLFRDEVQLAALSRHVLAPLAKRARRPLFLWSAGCATGEEVATLLILLWEAGAHQASSVLGTDIAETALAQARALSFPQAVVKRLPEALLERYFRADNGNFTLDSTLKGRASFQRHNLMDLPYPRAADGGGFDVIVCRNVLIYFTEAAFEQVVTGLAERLRPGGMLVLAAAEPILRRHPLLETFKCDQAFFYMRRDPDAARRLPSERLPLDRRDMTPVPSLPGEVFNRREPATAPPLPAPFSVQLPEVVPVPRSESTPTFRRPRADATPFPSRRPELTPMPFPPRPELTPMPFPRPELTPIPFPRTELTPMPFPRTELTPMPFSSPRTELTPMPFPSPRTKPTVEPTPVQFPMPRALPAPKPKPAVKAAPPSAPAPAEDPRAEATRMFEQVLEWAASGSNEPRTEQGLRQCLYLDPHFAQARYLLGTLLEQRGQRADAASEYRRALSALNEGRSRRIGFFLNDERMKTACANALKRLGPP